MNIIFFSNDPAASLQRFQNGRSMQKYATLSTREEICEDTDYSGKWK